MAVGSVSKDDIFSVDRVEYMMNGIHIEVVDGLLRDSRAVVLLVTEFTLDSASLYGSNINFTHDPLD